MAPEETGTTTETQDTGGVAQTPDAPTAAQATGAAPNAGLTQAQVDAIVTKRLAQAAKAHGDEKAALQAKLDEYATQEQARADAEKTEAQKLAEAATAADARAQAAEAKAVAAELARIRAEKIAENAAVANLPAVYKKAITGASAEELDASIVAVLAAFETDKAAVLAGAQPPPQSIGSAGHAGAPQAPGPTSPGLSLQDIQKLPSGQRENALVEYLARGK